MKSLHIILITGPEWVIGIGGLLHYICEINNTTAQINTLNNKLEIKINKCPKELRKEILKYI